MRGLGFHTDGPCDECQEVEGRLLKANHEGNGQAKLEVLWDTLESQTIWPLHRRLDPLDLAGVHEHAQVHQKVGQGACVADASDSQVEGVDEGRAEQDVNHLAADLADHGHRVQFEHVEKAPLCVVQAFENDTWQIRIDILLSKASSLLVLSDQGQQLFGLSQDQSQRKHEAQKNEPPSVEVNTAQLDVARSVRLRVQRFQSSVDS